jgi:hypothetical protein
LVYRECSLNRSIGSKLSHNLLYTSHLIYIANEMFVIVVVSTISTCSIAVRGVDEVKARLLLRSAGSNGSTL